MGGLGALAPLAVVATLTIPALVWAVVVLIERAATAVFASDAANAYKWG